MTTKTKARFAIRTEKGDRMMTFRVFDGGLAVGSAFVMTTTSGYGYVHGMYVRSDRRRMGAGHALMAAIIAEYGTRCRLELVCGSSGEMTNDQLGKFYAQYGFAYGPSAWTRRDARESDARRMFRPTG